MRNNQKAAAPVRASAANRNINAQNNTMPVSLRARPRVKMTPEQRGWFWESVGEAIEAARAGARGGRAS